LAQFFRKLALFWRSLENCASICDGFAVITRLMRPK